jgi:spore coat protein U-like protein
MPVFSPQYCKTNKQTKTYTKSPIRYSLYSNPIKTVIWSRGVSPGKNYVQKGTGAGRLKV